MKDDPPMEESPELSEGPHNTLIEGGRTPRDQVLGNDLVRPIAELSL